MDRTQHKGGKSDRDTILLSATVANMWKPNSAVASDFADLTISSENEETAQAPAPAGDKLDSNILTAETDLLGNVVVDELSTSISNTLPVADQRSLEQSVYNPAGGLIIAADDHKGHHRAVNDSSSARISHILQQHEHVSLSELKTLLLDTYSPSSMKLKALILSLPISDQLATFEQAALHQCKKVVSSFDGFYRADGGADGSASTASTAAAVLLEAFRTQLITNVLYPLGNTGKSIAGAPMHAVSRHSRALSFRYLILYQLVCF